MKKYIYILISSISLITVLGFTTSHFKNNTCKTELFVADIKEKQIQQNLITGNGLFQDLTKDHGLNDLRVANIQLAPKSYLHWHSLPGGRVIIVTDGEGFYQSKGKDVVKLKKGDTIETTPGLYHWLGSSPNGKMEFISISTQKSEELVNWHESLSVAEYDQAVKSTNIS
ncbi:cupin domain-containing protein [Sphingobacterium sp. MYb388]|uniref:cupin domain-containing protein n=1 Tax=Sphingobacterium sp. MYb388 TaxID=2745437 RepID=UPI0030AD39CF